jgi:cell division protease FtsH
MAELKKQEKKSNPSKNLVWWCLVLLIIGGLYYLAVNAPKVKVVPISYTDFVNYVKENKVKRVIIAEKYIMGSFKGEESFSRRGKRIVTSEFQTMIPYADPAIVRLLEKHGVYIEAQARRHSFLYESFTWALPLILVLVFWIFLIRRLQSPQNRAFAFGRSRAKLISEKKQQVTFKDVAGVEEAKEELREIIAFLKDPLKFQRLGGKIPRGVLILGPPGSGKTLLARAVAGEANVPFFTISGSDFVEMFVGVGAARVRDLFEQGKKNAPCLIFIDEIDAVGRYRGAGLGGGHDEREQTLNQLLVEMDGFDPNEGIILIAASNRPDILDPALLRPGRFDRHIIVTNPDVRGREEILKVHTRKIALSKNVDLSVIAKGTPGFSGADLANMVNEAALLAARKGKKEVELQDLEEAKDRVIMGPQRKSLILSNWEKKNTAYHESGHALVAHFLKHADPVHKITIIPRGRSLGGTHFLPLEDKYTYTKSYLLDQITVHLGGRAAEEVIFQEFSTGAGADIKQATEMVRKMICEWGMSEQLGPITYGRRHEQVFLGRDLVEESKNFSDETAKKIDEEIKRIIDTQYARAKKIIQEKKAILEELAKLLMEKEVLTGEEIKEFISQRDGQRKDKGSN